MKKASARLAQHEGQPRPPAWRRGLGALTHALAIAALIGLGVALFGWLVRNDLMVHGGSPGQFTRIWQALEAPARHPSFGLIGWTPYWWAGYPELQFYPPGFVYAAAALRTLTFGSRTTVEIYQLLVWLAIVLPGLGVYLLVAARGFGAFAALVAGLAAFGFLDVTGGQFAAMDGSLGVRFAQALLPIFVLTGVWAIDHRPVLGGLLAGALGAAVALCHLYQWPLGALALALYALIGLVAGNAAGRSWRRRLARASLALAITTVTTLGLIAYWLGPLIVYRQYATPVVRVPWSDFPNWLLNGDWPALALLALLAVAGLPSLRPEARRLVLALSAAATFGLLAIILGYVMLIERLHIYTFDPLRFLESVYVFTFALAGIGVGQTLRRLAGASTGDRPGWTRLPVGLAAVGILILLVLPVARWADYYRPAPVREPRFLSQANTDYRLPELWAAIRAGPPGRVFAVSSQFRLRQRGGETWPTYLWTLVGPMTGRELIGGIFAHWSPLATAYWTGRADTAAMTLRTDLQDDFQVFGLNWQAMDSARLAAILRRLNVGVVVATEYDVYARTYLDRDPAFQTLATTPLWVVYGVRAASGQPVWTEATETRLTTTPRTPGGEWIVQIDAPRPVQVTLSQTEYPTWRVETVASEPVPITRDDLGLMVVTVPAGATTLRVVEIETPIHTATRVISYLFFGLVPLAALGAAVWPVLPRRRAPAGHATATA